MTSNTTPSELSTAFIILRPFVWILTLLKFTYFLISSLILWIIRPLASRCQTFRLARELDMINEKMRKLRSEYENATRHYHEQCQCIDQKRRELNERKDYLVLQLATIDQWSKQVRPKEPIKLSTNNMKTISTTIKEHESITKNVDTKSMAKWFDRQFSCGSQTNIVNKTLPLSSTLLRSPSRTDHLNKKSAKILKKSTSLLDTKPSVLSSSSSSSSKINLKSKNQSKYIDNNKDDESKSPKQLKSDDDKVLDQMLTKTLDEFRSNETNSELNRTIRELYNDPEWKPMIDQLRNQYQLFSFI